MIEKHAKSDIEVKVKQLLISELNVNPTIIAASDSGTPLLGRGIGLDSVETMALILAIEDEFEISVPNSDLTAALFETIETLTRYVSQKITAREES
jgi:acyl carrier protein